MRREELEVSAEARLRRASKAARRRRRSLRRFPERLRCRRRTRRDSCLLCRAPRRNHSFRSVSLTTSNISPHRTRNKHPTAITADRFRCRRTASCQCTPTCRFKVTSCRLWDSVQSPRVVVPQAAIFHILSKAIRRRPPSVPIPVEVLLRETAIDFRSGYRPGVVTGPVGRC